MNTVWLFVILQLVNVILSTLRSILTIRASTLAGALINAISYSFYNAIVKMITSQDITVIVATTFCTNFLGVYIAKWIIKITSKPKIWRISTVCENYERAQKIAAHLQHRNIEYIMNPCFDKRYSIDIMSYTYAESEMINEILKRYKMKSYVYEINKKL